MTKKELEVKIKILELEKKVLELEKEIMELKEPTINPFPYQPAPMPPFDTTNPFDRAYGPIIGFPNEPFKTYTTDTTSNN